VIILQGINDASVRCASHALGFMSDYSHFRTPLICEERSRIKVILSKISYLYSFMESIINRNKGTITYHATRKIPVKDIKNNPWNVFNASSTNSSTSSYAFYRNTLIMTKLLESLNIKVILATEPYDKSKLNEELYSYIKQHNNITRDLSKKYHFILVDLEKEMSDKNEYFIKDGVHMTDPGAGTKAALIFSAIEKHITIK